jgi:hypothetical protein
MSLNLSKLEKVRYLAKGSVEARCPACAEGGHDRKGEHLLIKPDGRFGCCANPKDREHRKRIFALAGDTAPRSIKVKPPAVKVAAPAVMSGVFGRLGRVFASPAKADNSSDASDGVGKVQPELDGFRTLRTGETESSQDEQSESRTFRTPPNIYTCGAENQDRDVCIEIQGVPVRASVPSEPGPRLVESEQGVRGVRMPYLTPGRTLVIPFDSAERFHWWKGGQSVAETRAEVERWMAEAERKDCHGTGV